MIGLSEYAIMISTSHRRTQVHATGCAIFARQSASRQIVTTFARSSQRAAGVGTGDGTNCAALGIAWRRLSWQCTLYTRVVFVLRMVREVAGAGHGRAALPETHAGCAPHPFTLRLSPRASRRRQARAPPAAGGGQRKGPAPATAAAGVRALVVYSLSRPFFPHLLAGCLWQFSPLKFLFA